MSCLAANGIAVIKKSRYDFIKNNKARIIGIVQGNNMDKKYIISMKKSILSLDQIIVNKDSIILNEYYIGYVKSIS